MFQSVYFLLMAAMAVTGSEIVVKPIDAVGIYGVDVVAFNCSTNGPLSVMWKFRNGSANLDITFEGEVYPSKKPRYTSANFNRYGQKITDLIVPKIDFDHAGIYTCIDADGLGESFSAQLTVLKSPTLRIHNATDETFVFVSELEYAGNVQPRIECVDVGNDKSINVSKSSFNHRSVTWTSDFLLKSRCYRIIKCIVKFCSSDTDCHPRTFERLLRVNGSDAISGNLTAGRIEISVVPENKYILTGLYIAIPLLVIFALTSCIILWVYVMARRQLVPSNRIFTGERRGMIGR
jgi:hypothetical protein